MKNAVNANIKNTIPPMMVTEKEKKKQTNKLLHLEIKHSKLRSNNKDHGILLIFEQAPVTFRLRFT